MINKVTLLGRLGQDPEFSFTPAGLMIGKFSLATSEKTKQNGEYKEKVTWHRCVAFGKLAEIMRDKLNLSKGSLCYVEGKINYSTSVKNGQKTYYTDIIVQEFKILDRKQDQGHEIDYNKPVEDDEIPF